jgi:uncharacterized membrane protein
MGELPDGVGRRPRGALGIPLVLATLVAAGIAAYLSVVKLLGEAPACGPSHGCETVQSSEYSTLFGVLPVAFLGFGLTVVLAALAARWWLRADRWALLAAYLLLILATVFAGYLTYLELFEIRAICPWCVGFAVSIVVALAVAGVALLRTAGATRAD